jgi:hypothetical protein
MDKEKLIKEKMALVAQFNALQEKINSYNLEIVVEDCAAFKKEANMKKRIEERIKEINKLLNDN